MARPYYQTALRDAYLRMFHQLLASRGTLLTAEAAAHLNVTQRTIHRYTKVLRSQGFRIDGSKGRGGGIRLR